MATIGAPVLVEIRQPIEFGKAVGVILVHHMNLHFAEKTRQRDLACW